MCHSSVSAARHSKLDRFSVGTKTRFAMAVFVVLMLPLQSHAVCNCDPDACCVCSPIIIDVTGNGFHLTSAAGGVVFDISGTGHPVQISWTAADSNNAFLALPASDGLIHGGKELFGTSTPQPPSQEPNGFKALAVYDLATNGGNGDGIIDSKDAIFNSLRLWIDANHDGIAQPDELHTLSSLGVESISLKYRLSRRKDQYGNQFRYRGEVTMKTSDGGEDERVTYDVLLTSVDKPH
jgi:hypothetical protein